MKISVNVTYASAEVVASARQMESYFHATVGAHSPMVSGIQMLWICLSIMHPIAHVPRLRGSGSYSKQAGDFYAIAPIVYADWVSGGWHERVTAFADAATRAVQAIHKTRITETERAHLLTLIEDCASEIAGNPPADLVEVLPVHLIYGEGETAPSSVSYDQSAIGRFATGRIVVVPPSEAGQYVGVLAPRTEGAPQVFKLYRRVDGRLNYRQAWPIDGHVIEHWGVCGDRGQTRQHAARDPQEQKRVLGRIKGIARASKFRPVPPSKQATVVVECSIEGFGSQANLDRRHALEAFLSEQCGWMGLGHCDGGSTGSGSMEVFCIVVDAKIAKQALTLALAASSFGDFNVRVRPRH